MSHHSSDKSLTDLKDEILCEAYATPSQPKLNDALAKQKAEMLRQELGATNEFPAGRLVTQDEGGLMFGITEFKGRLVFDFGKPVRSIGFTRDEALALAETIKARAETLPKILFPSKPT